MPQYPFAEIKDRLDDWRLFNNMVGSPYYRDAVYEKFSDGEYQRRYEALTARCGRPQEAAADRDMLDAM